ncbi:MAG TPA: zinc-binding dehydrogenase [Gemmatimonadaceae bacterium]|jgi:NADPH2:quinone reductase
MATREQRRVAVALKAGGPDVIVVETQTFPPLQTDEVLVRVEAVGLNHVEILARSGEYAVAFPFPFAVGFEGAGRVVAVGRDVTIPIETRVCWTAVFGSCATHVVARAVFLAEVPDDVSLEEAATLAHAAVTAEGLARHWPLSPGACAVVWGAAGAVGRVLVSRLADRGIHVIGIASGDRTDAVRAVGATRAVDRTCEDTAAVVRESTGGRGASAVFDPIGAATYETSLALLAPRGCLVNYGQLAGALPSVNLAQLMTAGSIFVTKYGPRAGLLGVEDLAPIISSTLRRAGTQPLSAGVAARFPLDAVADAYRAMDTGAPGKVLVLPGASIAADGAGTSSRSR